MTSTAAFIATSLDGYIARKDGSLDWLDRYSDVAAEDTSYTDFISRIDVIVMGRRTFEKVLTFGFWPYENMPVRVWSDTLKTLPAELAGKAALITGTPAEVLAQLDREAFRRAYVDGGKTIQGFLGAGLLDEMPQPPHGPPASAGAAGGGHFPLRAPGRGCVPEAPEIQNPALGVCAEPLPDTEMTGVDQCS